MVVQQLSTFIVRDNVNRYPRYTVNATGKTIVKQPFYRDAQWIVDRDRFLMEAGEHLGVYCDDKRHEGFLIDKARGLFGLNEDQITAAFEKRMEAAK